jgi:hypothetical protein
MAAIKSKYLNHPLLESDLGFSVLTIQPRMSYLVSNMQDHPTHLI